ncbi:hypothetical protein GCM10028796_12500 [Ramlibacter monticola]
MAMFALALAGQPLAQPASETRYFGMAEASAAAMLDEKHFVVAEDECNTLLVYALGHPKPVGKPIDLAKFLGTGEKASDIEGGARVGDVIYWISSHSLPKSGKPREWRKRFFATKVDAKAHPPTVRPHGSAYAGLLEDMIAAPELRDLNLAEAAKLLPEQEGGLNIEGLAAWKSDGLLIGFRGPLRAGRAPVVPFRNPAAVVDGGRAKFDTPILLDLGGRGIRSIDRIESHYLIVAGPVGDGGTFAIYRWTGKAADAPVLASGLPSTGIAPEALLATPTSRKVTLLSDDGSMQPEAACGSGTKAQQQFRALRVDLP